jgi:hypothetical protein
MKNQQPKVQRFINEQIKQQIEEILKKTQTHHLDPVGFGMHVRADHYRAWKKIKDRWPEAISDAEFHVTVHTKILGSGVLQ